MLIFKKLGDPDDSHDFSEIAMKLSSHLTLNQVLEEFETFLKAVGYNFEGHLDIVEDENDKD